MVSVCLEYWYQQKHDDELCLQKQHKNSYLSAAQLNLKVQHLQTNVKIVRNRHMYKIVTLNSIWN
jgi:hypothetical protein